MPTRWSPTGRACARHPDRRLRAGAVRRHRGRRGRRGACRVEGRDRRRHRRDDRRDGGARRAAASGSSPRSARASRAPATRSTTRFLRRFAAADPANERFFAEAARAITSSTSKPMSRTASPPPGVTRVEALGLDTYADEDRFFSYRRATHRGEPAYGRQIASSVCISGLQLVSARYGLAPLASASQRRATRSIRCPIHPDTAGAVDPETEADLTGVAARVSAQGRGRGDRRPQAEAVDADDGPRLSIPRCPKAR